MQSPDANSAIHLVVTTYYHEFVRDPVAAAALYGEPALIVLPDRVFSLATRQEIEAFLADGLARLKALGYAATRMSGERIRMLNTTTALYGTVAIRTKADGTELERVAFTYLLHDSAAGWKIHQLIATDIDKLMA